MLRYSDELIEEIRNRNDIIDIVSQYVVLKRSGRSYFGLCPFHNEKSPSFAVSPDKQIFHCFGCGVGGNVFHFLGKIENIDFRETVQILAERAGITLPVLENIQDNKKQQLKEQIYQINKTAAEFYHQNLYLSTSKIAQDYIKKRKLDNATLKSFKIGYSGTFNELYNELKKNNFSDEAILASSLVNKTENGKYIDRFRNRLMFPIMDIRNKVIAFGGRVLDDSKPKYINSPENLVYNKGRNLFGLNIAKKNGDSKIIIVEGYMDAISLYQRGIQNVVASLGTALTEAQGRLLRRYSSQIIIGYDSDGAGQAATLRGMEILQNLGCDIRILQLDGEAKDPDEYVVKYGSGRFNTRVEKAISLVEFKVKILKTNLNPENTSDKIKFLNEIAKLLSKVENKMEREVYIEKISNEYKISKEAIYAEINKILYSGNNITTSLEVPRKNTNLNQKKNKKEEDSKILKRENTVIFLLINSEFNAYEKIKDKISPDDLKIEKNKKIIKKLYEEYKRGNSISNILDYFKDDEELINHITYIMAYDFEISDVNKCIEDILKTYEKEKMIDSKNAIINKIKNVNLSHEEVAKLEAELQEIIIKIAKMK